MPVLAQHHLVRAVASLSSSLRSFAALEEVAGPAEGVGCRDQQFTGDGSFDPDVSLHGLVGLLDLSGQHLFRLFTRRALFHDPRLLD